METGTTIRLLELADVNEDPRTATERRDEAESPGDIPLREPALLFHARLRFADRLRGGRTEPSQQSSGFCPSQLQLKAVAEGCNDLNTARLHP